MSLSKQSVWMAQKQNFLEIFFSWRRHDFCSFLGNLGGACWHFPTKQCLVLDLLDVCLSFVKVCSLTEKITGTKVSILLVSPFLMGAQTSLAIWLTKGVVWGFRRKVSIAERVRTPSKIDFSLGNLGKLFRQEFVVIAVFYWDLGLEKESDLECISSGSWGMAADPCSNPPL